MSKLSTLGKVADVGAEAASEIVRVARVVHRDWRASEGSDHRFGDFCKKVNARVDRWLKENYATLV